MGIEVLGDRGKVGQDGGRSMGVQILTDTGRRVRIREDLLEMRSRHERVGSSGLGVERERRLDQGRGGLGCLIV